MEFVEGRDLRDYFAANERFASADAFRIMGEILAALEYSHARGVVHRDIKPANVFLQKDGTVKVADFGIAHIESSSLTQAGTVMGTPGYMSPEQVLGLPVDGRSDLFSVGVILYQFLTGERPFSGSATTTAQKVLKEDPLPPSTLNVQLPDAIDAVVRKALAKKPEERFQTAAEFAAALRAAAGHRATSAPLPAASTAMDAATEVHVPSAAPGTVVRVAGAPVAAPAPAAQQAPAYAKPKSQATAIAVVGAVVVAAVAVGMWIWLQRPSAPVSVAASSAPPSAASPAAAVSAAAVPVAPSTTPAPVESAPAANAAPAPKPAPGTMVITAVGVADPANPRYQGDAALLQQDLRADANSQLVQKALGLMVEPASLAKNYDVLNDRLVTKGSGFVGNVVREGAPSTGKSGLVTLTTEAVVDVKAVQKSLNEMSRKERIQLIRAGGDPRIALKVSVRDADAPNAAPRASPAAENLLKDRIRSFGFRTWSDTAEPGQVADFLVTGEARVRRLTTRLEASGITVTKYAVVALSVKCVDRATGEEIYYNTALPKGTGSWATEEEALRAVGGKMADEFSRDFFLAHVNPASRRVALVVDGLPEGTADVVGREFASLPAVIAAKPRADGARRVWDLELGGSGSATDRLAAGVFAPLNRKLGQSCFATAGSEGDEVRATFDARCTDPGVLSRLETHPPAGLYAAPPGRTSGIVKNPDTLRKLSL
jgi:serine/threonine-protein kinase